MNELALFAGAGGGILASKLLGWCTVAACEIERYPREVLLQRQRDGILEPFPIWDDIKTFDGKPFRGKIDIVTGGFPCQDISAAGKGAGLAGARSGLWSEMRRVIGEVEPGFVFAENSPVLRTRGLGTVIKDLTSMGYDVRWCVLGAWHIGANHKRNRMWILAYRDCVRKLQQKGTEQEQRRWACNCCENVSDSQCIRQQAASNKEVNGTTTAEGQANQPRGCCEIPNTNCKGLEVRKSQPCNYGEKQQATIREGWWQLEPDVGRLANGVASRVDRLKALGNGQVPAVAATAFRILSDGLIN